MTNITGNLYAERDHEAMGDYYLRHVDRMTREGLHAKSDIAAELGFRDMEIDRLRTRLNTAGHAHLDGAHLSRKVDGCLLCEAMTERETLRARVAELEAARGEPVAWMLKTGHGTAFATTKPKCEVDL